MENFSEKHNLGVLFIVIGLFFVFSIFSITRSVVIDSGDANYFMERTSSMHNTRIVPTERPLFLVLADGLASITHVSLYFAFRWLLVGLGSLLFFPYFLLLCKTKERPLKVLFVLLLLFAVPTLLIEMAVVRPQFLLIIGLPAFIYFLARGRETNDLGFYLLSGLIAFSGLLIHELFVTTAVVFCCFIAYQMRHKIRTSPLRSFGFIALLGMAVYPYVRDFGFINFVSSYLNTYLIPGIHNFHFRIWFLDSIISVANDNVSWVGWENVVKYYLYYVGPSVIGIIVSSIYILSHKSFRKSLNKIDTSARLALVFLVLFLVSAEVAPRLGIGYLPERSWLFFDISAFFILPVLIKFFAKMKRNETVLAVILVIFSVGFGGACYVAQAKGGLITSGELSAAKDLRTLLSNNSILITQEGNKALLREYALKNSIIPPSGFFSGERYRDKLLFIAGLTSRCGDVSKVSAKKQTLRDSLQYFAEDPKPRVRDYINQIQDYSDYFEKLKECEIDDNTSIYVVYSTDKKNNYLANRPYFRDENFLDADLSIFNSPEFVKIYESKSMVVWQVVRKSINSIK